MASKTKNKPSNGQKAIGTVTVQIIQEFKDRQRVGIKNWREAIEMATHPETPKPYMLQDIYDNLKSDGHFIGDMRVRKAATLAFPFSIIDKDTKEVNEEKTDIFKKKWFYDLMKNALDTPVRGYTLMELIDPVNIKFKLVKRRNVVALNKLVLLSVQDDKGLPYADEIGRTLIELGEEDELGIMADICGQLIWKRNAQQSWAEFAEKFGMPLITATTNKSNPADIREVNKMLRAMGEASTGVFAEGTKIEIKEFTKGDSFMVYDKLIERTNKEVSKALLSGTMVTDDGSSRSQSEVHERTLNDKIAGDDRRTIEFTVNEQLIPMLALWGHNINPETDKFRFDPTDELSLVELWAIVDKLLEHGDVPIEWISEKFGVPITGLKQRQPELQTPTNSQPMAKGFSANFR